MGQRGRFQQPRVTGHEPGCGIEIVSKIVEGKDAAPTKFDLYKDFAEPVATIPSHRFLAVRRGERLFTLYSPELLATENEYLLALAGQGALVTVPRRGARPGSRRLTRRRGGLSDPYKSGLRPRPVGGLGPSP